MCLSASLRGVAAGEIPGVRDSVCVPGRRTDARFDPRNWPVHPLRSFGRMRMQIRMQYSTHRHGNDLQMLQ
jgi:hypothetical protein